MHELADNLNFTLLNIGFSELNADWNWKNIRSPFARIYYVVSGEAKTYINGQKYILKPGNLYLTPPFTLHDDECDSPFSLYYIHFYEKVYNKEPLFDKLDFPVEICADALDRLLVKRLLDINPDRDLKQIDPGMYDNTSTFFRYISDNNLLPLHSFLETQGILCRLVSRFLEFAVLKTIYKDWRINKCMQHIHENMDTDITLHRLAGIACISVDHLARLFKKDLNCTPVKYINRKKMERAQLLLLTTDMPVADIAMDLSIDNISYFDRLFKQYTGFTPSGYRSKYNI
ncbi:helix-turn-helix domain-containing protein [Dysgonomonas sp. GY75]|uniref:AraC family transcriptional regulator n=1 Tax=Dysgonomonas sp. GY75 TaxID=2780419 RepID=UPI001883FAE2|nr:AraC family transcriptional regulator [Dysgonomonas sp. GY75]MBF0648013.1 helix-turn-helix domain-containing protein [Dysgonomonas sp. GY75]